MTSRHARARVSERKRAARRFLSLAKRVDALFFELGELRRELPEERPIETDGAAQGAFDQLWRAACSLSSAARYLKELDEPAGEASEERRPPAVEPPTLEQRYAAEVRAMVRR